jgi:oxygen-independent coproporphyrinogen III oxidase
MKQTLERMYEDDSGSFHKKYESTTIPYYTSYPTGGQWDPDFGHESYIRALGDSAPKGTKVPMALYIHFPFCPELCYFCFCVKTITKNRDRITVYLEYLHREIDMLLSSLDALGIEPDVRQISLGGGTPTFMSREEFSGVLAKLSTFADLSNLEELSLEVDPRTVSPEDMAFYLESGISRLSFGIQDFDPAVQEAINRVQPFELIQPLLADVLGGTSVNFDLIYGLPYSSRETFKETIRLVRALNPDRLAVYRYDHTPDIHKNMSAIPADKLPSQAEMALMYTDAVLELLGNGYEYIGIDHLAKTDDTLAKAYREEKIWRNINGYTTYRGYDFSIGLGNSSIGGFGGYYAQNLKAENDYYKSIDRNELPVLRGVTLSEDDKIRRFAIFSIVSRHRLRFEDVEREFDIDFPAYFRDELATLKELQDDGLVDVTNRSACLTDIGKLFAHHVAKAFDRYLVDDSAYVRTHAAIAKEKASA